METAMKKDIRSLTLPELREAVLAYGEKPFRANQVYEWLHKKCVPGMDQMTNVPKYLKERMGQDFHVGSTQVVTRQESKDGTHKLLIRLQDGSLIETVSMPYRDWTTACISSQVGCAQGCAFCASAVGGFRRSLTSGEMLEQVYQLNREGCGPISHVVVMGSGEPLNNYDNLVKWIRMITDKDGLNLSVRSITVSTSGIVPRIYELSHEGLPINLAISLHAPFNEKRIEIMPIARKYSIDQLIEACKYFFRQTGRRITIEYSLIKGFNDGADDARALSGLLRGFQSHVNLIPMNPVRESRFRESEIRVINRFRDILEKNRINVTIRREMGRDIDSACGQLRWHYMEGIHD
ncbi:MAG: 23S rRNA (adenine(2503)-C(2))-methyltransferase RlmN [Lachnospiraceae bacterium]|nr:23S rRNA (adenine(2503)-C(2))-methyltransferase RlmN [Lachnospiraceae bacterium]